MNLLRAIEHGWTPTGKKARDLRKKKHHSFGIDVTEAGWVPPEYGGSAWKGGRKVR